MATPLSLRFKEDTLQRLYFQAKLAGVPPRTLAQRMVEEAIRMTEAIMAFSKKRDANTPIGYTGEPA
jgi:hypothetical protein